MIQFKKSKKLNALFASNFLDFTYPLTFSNVSSR